MLKNLKSVIILSVVCLTVLAFTSCSDDDDNNNVNPLVGVWLQVSSSTETFSNGESQGVNNDVVDENNFIRITFNADGTFTEFYSDDFSGTVETETDGGTYTTSGNTITVEYNDGEVFEEQFTLEGDTLTFVSTETGGGLDFVTTSVYARQ